MAQAIAWLKSEVGKIVYSEGSGREKMPGSNATDCSGLNRYVFSRFFGINYIGDSTADQRNFGINLNLTVGQISRGEGLLPGDALFWLWEHRTLGWDPWDHTNFVIDSGHVANHGGPGKGPVIQTISSNVNECVAVMARRFVTVGQPAPPVPTEEFTVAQYDNIMAAIAHNDAMRAADTLELKNLLGSLAEKIVHGHGITEPGPNGDASQDAAMGMLRQIAAHFPPA